ncbi:TPA: pilus assembly protein [Burkholderia cenocepacia]|uniref:pilus assembly protein n=1 Tax=Burkholderia cenocepacia TaxID=95486 RepID=UPI000F5AE25A|nr:pilus assembly protein [Burkholderia cenocepacia]MBR8196411.1 pilus assembly protein [Burkholderia cenocepacia]MBR8376553.1 pilus assembly protein [Burkholderia cenocepacia]MDS0850369.1 pilus assembly protein [Burkholderia cenocepacia]MEB2610905.1 pilus assembly protein [Burkholderia cenocepacia]RQV22578.1 pilus assembly protein [Burkholderia cenocepacia]
MNRLGWVRTIAGATACALLASGCAMFKESGYGIGAQAERGALMQAAADKNAAPDTPGMYLGLIERMQGQGLYFASLAHIDQYEKQYGASPDTILLRADALRATGQYDAGVAAYTKLLTTPLAARGYRGLGLTAGARGDFALAAQQLEQATALAPTDAATLSDLAYSKMREGDLAGARVPLLKAAELEQKNPKILSNFVLYLLATGHAKDARRLMDQQKLSPAVRSQIRDDETKVAAAMRAKQRAVAYTPASVPVPSVASSDNFDLAVPLLQRFAR